jgi:DNA topoisomerase-3
VLATSTAADVALQASLGACPKCGAAVHAHGTNYVCINSMVSPAQAVPSCDFKTGQVILQQAISAEQLGKLLTSGRTDLLDGFISARTQKAFKAMLVWDAKAGKVGFEFGSSRA